MSNPYDTHPYDTHAYDTHPYDTHDYDTHPYDTHPYDTHPYDTHAYDTHAYDTHAVLKKKGNCVLSKVRITYWSSGNLIWRSRVLAVKIALSILRSITA